MHRRRFLLATSAALAAGAESSSVQARTSSPFLHGVASGDPLSDRVVLWTRVSVDRRAHPEVRWVVAHDEALSRVAAHGVVTTSPARDHTVKIDVTGLHPDTRYWYAFETGGHRSPIGRTRTLPIGTVERARFAVVSCANFPTGFYAVYAAIAQRDDIDAVIHLGDYIYEYADGSYGNARMLGRACDPPHECVSLSDYRRRHASYKLDPDLQDVHAKHPFIVVWDDHESANNAWSGGAANHQPREGAWSARRVAAVRAYREWMPIRDDGRDEIAIHRALRWGSLVDLLMLDTRLAGREKQPRSSRDDDRTLLGPAQEAWLDDTLARSQQDGVCWRLLGQQVRMGQLRAKTGSSPRLDVWDGYPRARDRFFASLERGGIRDVVVLTGDTHSSWALELHRDPFASTPTPALAVELITPAVSSPTLSAAPSPDRLLATHPHLRWVDFRHRGYIALDVSTKRLLATWHLVRDVSTPHADVPAARTFEVRRGESHLRATDPPDDIG
jgi:alkaline phosphatase D